MILQMALKTDFKSVVILEHALIEQIKFRFVSNQTNRKNVDMWKFYAKNLRIRKMAYCNLCISLITLSIRNTTFSSFLLLTGKLNVNV